VRYDSIAAYGYRTIRKNTAFTDKIKEGIKGMNPSNSPDAAVQTEAAVQKFHLTNASMAA
jgi:hypothetical protein